MRSDEVAVEVDIPCDVQQEDQTGYVWAFLDEARDPSQIAEGAIVVSGDEVDPVFARVVSLTARPGGTKVHLEMDLHAATHLWLRHHAAAKAMASPTESLN